MADPTKASPWSAAPNPRGDCSIMYTGQIIFAPCLVDRERLKFNEIHGHVSPTNKANLNTAKKSKTSEWRHAPAASKKVRFQEEDVVVQTKLPEPRPLLPTKACCTCSARVLYALATTIVATLGYTTIAMGGASGECLASFENDAARVSTPIHDPCDIQFYQQPLTFAMVSSHLHACVSIILIFSCFLQAKKTQEYSGFGLFLPLELVWEPLAIAWVLVYTLHIILEVFWAPFVLQATICPTGVHSCIIAQCYVWSAFALSLGKAICLVVWTLLAIDPISLTRDSGRPSRRWRSDEEEGLIYRQKEGIKKYIEHQPFQGLLREDHFVNKGKETIGETEGNAEEWKHVTMHEQKANPNLLRC
ncbi:hypothetical protein AAMO2058_000461400 [Amorphochlora amoebiformis]